MKKLFACLLGWVAISQVYAQPGKSISASLGKVKVQFILEDGGKPAYTVTYGAKPVINKSNLGFALADDSTFYKGFKLLSTKYDQVDESWAPVWGEVNSIRNHYQQVTVHLQQEGGKQRLLNVVFRVFEDGVGFRYEFPKQANLNYFIVTQEKTEFALASDAKAFWIPGDYDSNEYAYSTTKVSEIDNQKIVGASGDIAVRLAPDRYSVQTPLMLKSDNGLYINIHEAALRNYSSMQLHVDRSQFKLKSSLVPDAVGNMAYLHAPFHTPWRTVIVSGKAADILSSKMILNLNDPSKVENTSWIKPMKFVGVWWEMQIGKSTWSYAKSMNDVDANGKLIPSGLHGANTANVKRYIDFAARHGIPGVLVEGWNTGWEDWFGNWKEDVFDFVTPYPDFDVAALTSYARAKGVSIIMHNETSGSATNYERQLDTAYRFMNEHSYPAVKTGYVGKIIPRGEHHDGQWMVNHYARVAQKAAEHHVMLDAHEPVRPTGLQRTYPNWMASEAGRGNEYNAFSEGNLPEHETILPFTRLMGGPMDYTPGIFKLKGYTTVPNRQVHTTLAKQLALYVTMYSPLQMVADLPENYDKYPDAFQFIKDVAVDWDDTYILEAEPGDYLTIARKAKGKNEWFIGGITDEHSRTANFKLNFLPQGRTFEATIYEDGRTASFDKNPESYAVRKIKVTSKTVLQLKIAPGGGFALSIN
ncbi:glycoside hydrolase family 97 protein [Mucilaginibacter sp. PAMB04274]|uniref:glycoside hydrolase family 97 protein n=1 Tax=Mucilaginibacter sp. PAMB04274 TaxID=3138568 RepID=UPI0031F65895